MEVFCKKLNEKNEPFVRHISIHPPAVNLYSNEQLKAYTLICRKDIVYFDATGSVLKRPENCNDFQIYTLLVRNPAKGGPGLPVATSISTKHDAGTICRFLELFVQDAFKLFGFNKKPILVMVDGSMAMWNAVLRAFTNETRIDYYNRCWRIVTGKACANDLKKTFFQNCLSHAMRAAKILVGKYYKRAYRNVALFWIGKLFSVSTFDQLDSVMESIIVVTNCENSSGFVKNHFEKLKHGIVLDVNYFPHEFVSESNSKIQNEDFHTASKYTDEKQETNSPFYLHFTKKLNQFLQTDINQNHKRHEKTLDNVLNVYFDNTFCKKLIRVIGSRICCTSKLLLGDLSRHKNVQSSFAAIKLYLEYSALYKQIQKASPNFAVENNLTQGVIEQHFNTLKNVCLKGNRICRIDDFVQKYYNELKITQQLFSDFALHHFTQMKKQIRKTGNVVLSKFRKR